MLVPRTHHYQKKKKALSGVAFDLTIRINDKGEIFLQDRNDKTSVRQQDIPSMMQYIQQDLEHYMGQNQ